MHYAGPVARDQSGRVTCYAALHWSADGTPSIVQEIHPFETLKEARWQQPMARYDSVSLASLAQPLRRKGTCLCVLLLLSLLIDQLGH